MSKDYFIALSECHFLNMQSLSELSYYPAMHQWWASVKGVVRAWTATDFGHGDFPAKPIASDLITYMDKFDVDVCFCLRESMTDMTGGVAPMSTNGWMLQQIEPYKGRMYLEANCGPILKRGTKHAIWEMEYLVKERGAKLCKLYQPEDDGGINDKRLWPYYEKAQELGVPLTIHTGFAYVNQPTSHCRTSQLDDVMLDFPGLKVIAYHAGWPDTEELCGLCGKHPNLYMSLTGIVSWYARSPYRGYHAIGTALQWMPSTKIVLGHDSAWPEMEVQLDYIKNLKMPDELREKWGFPEITEADKANILGLNLARLTGIEPTKVTKQG